MESETPRVLLVDDDQALLQALPHMIALRLHGVQVDTAASATEALEMSQSCDYDAIVSDIKMPGMDGMELLGRLRELRPETPVLLITGYIEQAMVIEAMQKGAYDFIQKPIDRVYFVAALHRAIQTHQLQHQVQEQQKLLASYTRTLQELARRHAEATTTTNEHEAVCAESPFPTPLWLIS
jgi:two-component system, sensor histidine kinase and response regulator